MRETRKAQENNKRRRKSKIRRQSMTCKDKREEQENMEVESIVDQSEKFSKYEKTRKPETDGSKTSAYTTLMENNRALAAALEDSQLDLRSVQLENVQLKEQIHENHHKFVEKNSELEKKLKYLEQLSENHAPKSAQIVFHDIYNLLSQSSVQYVQGTNFLSDAVNLVRSLLTQANGPMMLQNAKKHVSPHEMFNNVSPYVDPVVNSACTTPPPDEPSAMEITASQTILIETYDTAMTSLDRDIPFRSEQEDVSADTTVTDASILEVASRRSKRKSCMDASYAEPGLRSKLRRGDRFTDTTLYGEDLLKNTRKKKKSLTPSKRSASLPGMGNIAKKRAPLVNLTNIIKEEC